MVDLSLIVVSMKHNFDIKDKVLKGNDRRYFASRRAGLARNLVKCCGMLKVRWCECLGNVCVHECERWYISTSSLISEKRLSCRHYCWCAIKYSQQSLALGNSQKRSSGNIILPGATFAPTLNGHNSAIFYPIFLSDHSKMSSSSRWIE